MIGQNAFKEDTKLHPCHEYREAENVGLNAMSMQVHCAGVNDDEKK